MPNRDDFTAPDLPLPSDLGLPTVGETQGNFLAERWDSGKYSYRTEDGLLPPPKPLTAEVTAENPLEVDFFVSIRSPYSALMVHRCAWLQSSFNAQVTTRIVVPIALRNPGYFGGAAEPLSSTDTAPSNWYLLSNIFWDALRVAEYQGLDWYRNANPDPIKMDVWPLDSPTHNEIAGLDDQPWIIWMVRLACAAQLAGKSVDFAVAIWPIIWSDREFWPADIPEAFNKIDTGMSYDETIVDIQANPATYDAVFLDNERIQIDAGHGGIPVTAFRREPFYGQDRFDHMFYRLVQNGLTRRDTPIAPFVDEPLRAPNYEKDRKIIFGA